MSDEKTSGHGNHGQAHVHDHDHAHDHAHDHEHDERHAHDHHHHHHHGHGHDHHGHGHDHHGHGFFGHHHHDTSELSDTRLLGTVALNVLLTVVEVVVGIFSGSLALIADAVHNLGDAASLVIAWIARRISRKDADHRYTFGYQRAELIGAIINLTTLIVIAIFLVVEGVERFFDPQPIKAMWVMVAAGAALVVDLATVFLLWAMSKGSLNVRAAFIHNLTDAAASIAVILGALAVQFFGWTWVDPAITLLIAAYILLTSLSMLRRAAAILMNNAPPGLDIHEVKASLIANFDDVGGVHHVHVWEMDEHSTALEAHIVLSRSMALVDIQPLKTRMKDHLADAFRIGHSTLEFEPPEGDCTHPEC